MTFLSQYRIKRAMNLEIVLYEIHCYHGLKKRTSLRIHCTFKSNMGNSLAAACGVTFPIHSTAHFGPKPSIVITTSIWIATCIAAPPITLFHEAWRRKGLIDTVMYCCGMSIITFIDSTIHSKAKQAWISSKPFSINTYILTYLLRVIGIRKL